ncbi:penicillin acylase family protein [Stella sp.]|uniref:penicillin acylase family protein n=1 Tax=Stella sp. TaxID=2912054 RepID=UPI0035B4C889
MRRNGGAGGLIGLLALALGLFGCTALAPPETTVAARLAALPARGLALERPVAIRWNDHLVPWIEAETDGDLAFALGLVHGHLRGAQIQLLRLVARGRLSEVAGPFTTDIDHSLRILDFGRAAPEVVRRWPEETRTFVARFVDGLNHSVRHGPRPPEAGLLGLDREPFTAEDLVAIGRLAGTDINWLAYFSLLAERGRPDFARLWQRTLQAGAGQSRLEGGGQAALLGDILSGASRSGSNSMAVAARRSATGGALMANDPHLGLNLPNLWLVAGLRAPSFHAVGMMVPGLPFLAIGRSPNIAWGGTNLRAAASDLFDVAALPATEVRTTEVRIARRLWPDATRTVRTTPFGPIVTDSPLVPEQPGPLALRWVGHEPTDEITALLRAARARDVAEFRDAFAGFGVSPQNMLVADRAGSIAHLYAATLPDRPGPPPDGPVLDAADPAATRPWVRLRDARDLPFTRDPEDGVLASANDRPPPEAGTLGWFFSDDDRVRRLRVRLAAVPRLAPADLALIQADTRSEKAAALAARLLDRIDRLPGGPPEPAFLAPLRGWDGDYRAEARAPVVFEFLLARLVPAVRAAGGREANGNPRGPESGWNFLTAFALADLDALPAERSGPLLRAAVAAAAQAAAPYPAWGDVHRLRAAHWLVNLPVVGGRFVAGRWPVGGSRETPMKTSHGLVDGPHDATFGSMARHVSDMADPDANWFTLFGGQDGWLGSPAYADQIALWRTGRAIRVPLQAATVAAEFPHRTRLEPALRAAAPGI